jgi:hypothetical protein
LKKDKLPAISAVLTHLKYTFDQKALPVTLEFDFLERAYKKPSVVTKKIAKEQFAWSGKKIRLMTYTDVERRHTKLAVWNYNDHRQKTGEQWFALEETVFPLPLQVQYRYHNNGAYTVYGFLKEEGNATDSLIKFSQEFDSLGRITKRTLYNRDLRTSQPNHPTNMETFEYSYNNAGKVSGMTHRSGESSVTTHTYRYRNPDKYGNDQVQEVRDENSRLLYEIAWKMEYYPE